MANLVNGLGGTSGFGENSFRGGSGSSINGSLLIDLSAIFAGGLNFEGRTFTSLWLNENGNVSFDRRNGDPRPSEIPVITSFPVIAPFWGDVDTRTGGPVWWDIDPATKTFTATWDDVGRYMGVVAQVPDLLNSFQLQIVAVGTTGEFDIHFRYETLQWTKAADIAATNARGGYTSGNGDGFFEFTQTGTTAMANLTGLSNVGEAGHFVFHIGETALFTIVVDTIDFNNLTADQKAAIAGGGNIYNGLGGSDTVILPDPAKYDQVVGKTKEGVDIKLGWTDTSLSTFRTGSLAGDTYKVEASHGNRFFVAGAGNDTITLNGDGDNHVRAGSGETTIVLNSTSGNGDNVIVGGSGKTIVTLTGSEAVKGGGQLSVVAGSGRASVTVDANVSTMIHGGADAAHTATFDLISIESSEYVEINGHSTVTSLRLASDTTLTVAPDSFLQARNVRNVDGTPVDPGSIELEAGSTFQFGFRYDGIVSFSFENTLIIDSLQDVGFDPAIATAEHRGVVLENFDDSNSTIVLKNVNVQTGQIVSATVGEVKLKDGSMQHALRLVQKPNPSSDDAFASMIALDSLSLSGGLLDNRAYFTVKASADGQDTILTLKQGNASDDVLKGPQARAQHGVTGSGIKVGIISDSFANDAAAYTLDVQRGVLPAGITILNDSVSGLVFSGGLDEGRAMAQIIHAIAPGAEIIFYAVGSPVGFSGAVSALRAAGADIIVDDIGFTRIGERLPGLQSSITSAVRSGITYVTAAGNDGTAFPVYGHAAHPDAISVASVNVLATPSADFPFGDYLPAQTEPSSSVGANGKPDVSGPDRAQSTLPLGGELNPFLGTSASAPAVAAVVALMLQANPLLTADPKTVQEILEATAFAFGDPSTAGAGFVQADLAVAQALIAKDNFFEAGGSAPPEASFSVAMAPLAAGPQPLSAALSVPVGNAGTGLTVLMLVEMGQGVVVTGTPSFTLNTGGLFTYDSALSTVAAGRLLFTYTVGVGQQAPSLAITGFNGLVEDSSGNDADFSALFGLPTGLTINAPLKVSSVASSEKGVVMAGETIELTVTLNSGATLDLAGSAPTLVLNDGATALYDAASSNPAAGKLVFDYKVGAGERTPSLTIDRIELPDGTTLKDGKGNNADLAAALDQTMGVQVGPAFVSALFAPIEQTALPTGQTVELTIALSQGVVVDRSKGSPTLTLSNGATAIYDAASSDPSKGTLVFDYKAAAGDAAASNLLVSKVNLNGAVIRDAEGNPVDLAGAQNAPTALTIRSPLTVDSLAASKTGAIKIGESLQLTITMEDDLQVLVANSGGPPTLTLNNGGTATYNAVLSDPAAARLVFDYTVIGPAHVTANLAISQFNQNGAILFDDKGNFADLSGALNVPIGVQVVMSSSASIEAAAATKPEGQSGSSTFVFTVRLDGAAATSVTVAWAVSGSGANPASASDFSGGVLKSGIVTFAAGETSKGVVVTVLGDTAVEASEGFTVTLSTPSAGLVIGTATASGTIVNDDAAVSIAATSTAKAEGNGATTASTFTVTRSGDTSAAQTVSWAVSGSGANPASAADFAGGLLPSGSVTFAVGETTRTVAVNVQGDVAAEADEGFVVTLSNPSVGLTIGSATAAGIIQNDDAGPPTAYADAYVTLQGTAVVAAPATTGVLANDLGGPSLIASHQGGPSHGSLLFSTTGGFTYTPHAGYSGIDSFKYRASNGAGTDVNQAVIYVVPVSVGGATTLDLLALTAEEQIAATYAAFFGRAADAGGFGFWVSEFNSGLAQGPAALFANIASSFGVSDEARALYPFLANPTVASDSQVAEFLQSVYNNLFNRDSDPGGLGYWAGQIRQTLQAGEFVGSVLVNIMSGAQDSADGQDVTTLMGKVAVSLEYVHEQVDHHMSWAGNSDRLAATSLLQAVTSAPQTVLTGIRNAEDLVAAHS